MVWGTSNHVPHHVHRVILRVHKPVRDEAVVLTAVNTGTRHHAEVIHPTEWNNLLQTVHHDVNQDERVRNMPVARQERAFRL